MSEANEIAPGLHVGGQETTLDYVLRSGIKTIICLEERLFDRYPVDYLNITIRDDPGADIGMHFDTVYTRIRKALAKGHVLVQCRAGVSRSSTLAIMYLLRARREPLIEIFLAVKKRRLVIKPNEGFYKTLLKEEKRLLGASSMSMQDYSSL